MFIFSCHGVTFLDPATGGPAKMSVNVDTFTTARFGFPVSTYVYDTKTYSFFDAAHTYFTDKILDDIRDSPSPPDKAAIRDIISSSLCYTRDQVGAFVQGTCKFRCHEVGESMADMFIMSSGSAMNEVVLSVDLVTGTKKDVHKNFGFMRISDNQRTVTHPDGRKFIESAYNRAIQVAEREIDGLQERPEEFTRKSEHLAALKESLRGAVMSSKYRYDTTHEDKYVTVIDDGYSYKMIKLSDVIQIGIDNGTIKPGDFVIVQACRTFYGQLPGAIPTSPFRRDDATPSKGGRKRMRGTLGSLLTKNRSNRNKNKKNKNKHKPTKKRKRKTIRRLRNF
jgi:hypothetical protein